MARILSAWSALEPRRRLIAGLALAAVVAAVIGLVQAARTPSMAMLYSGLDAAAAGEVASAVEAMGVPVEVDGAAILVPRADRDRVRMALAADGLPRNGPAGYEILEGLDGFGTTAEMFEATYWRAKEGELARTILAAPGVRSARVHIANPVGRPFQRGAEPTASVTVTTSYGALDAHQAEAIRYMVASAVAGLAPRDVSVIDAAHGAILRMGENEADRPGAKSRADREAALRAEIERLLAARVGPGKAIVTVSVETDNETETVVERVLDPDSRVAISTDSRTMEESASGGSGGAATVASNIPVEEEGEGEQRRSSRNETEERVNYEVSELTRERVKRPGEISRISVAVLVDGVAATGEDGERVWAPRPAAEVEQLRELVRSAVGYDPERGDVVTVETLEFAPTSDEGVLAEAGLASFVDRHGVTLIQTAALALVALGLGLFVVRPLLAPPRQAEPPPPPPPDLPVLPGPDLAYGADDPSTPKDRLALLREVFDDQRDESASVLRGWLERDAASGEDDDHAERA